MSTRRFEDLLAARILNQQRPDLRQRLETRLRALAEDEKSGATLLGDLVREGTLTRDEAEQVYGMVDLYRRGRAVGIFAHLLINKGGLDQGAVEGLVRELGERATCESLGQAVVARSLIQGDVEAQLRYKARLAFDQDKSRQVKTYTGRRKRVQAESAPTMYQPRVKEPAGLQEEERLPSGVFKLNMDAAIPSKAEATFIMERTDINLKPQAAPPPFPIPDWIDTSDAMVGEQVGDYRVLGKVGAGAMGSVYLCDQPDRTTPIALKCLPPDASSISQAIFKREILANSFFSHENVVDIYDAGVTPQGHHYLAMEFFDGSDLEQILKTERTLSLREGLMIVRQILEALGAAHGAGVVHRDVKPANILVGHGGRVAKLMDFGIALIQDLGSFKSKVFESDAGSVTGTPRYMSPEMASRDPAGPASDLYSVGIVLYQILSGRLPFESETAGGWITCHIVEDPLPITEAAPPLANLPPELIKLFDRLFVKEAEERIQTAAEVLEVIDQIGLGLGTDPKSRSIRRFRRGF